jgi:hypothetical protein
MATDVSKEQNAFMFRGKSNKGVLGLFVTEDEGITYFETPANI